MKAFTLCTAAWQELIKGGEDKLLVESAVKWYQKSSLEGSTSDQDGSGSMSFIDLQRKRLVTLGGLPGGNGEQQFVHRDDVKCSISDKTQSPSLTNTTEISKEFPVTTISTTFADDKFGLHSPSSMFDASPFQYIPPELESDRKTAAYMVESILFGCTLCIQTSSRHPASYSLNPHSHIIDIWELLQSSESAALHVIKDYILISAVENGHVDVVDAVISILQPCLNGPFGSKAWMVAVDKGYVQVVARLISCGADYGNENISNHLIIAESNGHKEVLEYLKLSKNIRDKLQKASTSLNKKRSTMYNNSIINL